MFKPSINHNSERIDKNMRSKCDTVQSAERPALML